VVVSDASCPSLVGSYSSSTYINGASRIAYDATNRYVYVTAEVSDAMTIIDVGRTVVLYLAPPSPAPTNLPTTVPTTAPSIDPTAVPSLEPTAIPTLDPTSTPTALPTTAPTSLPTISSLPTEYGLMNSGATSADLATQGKQYTGTLGSGRRHDPRTTLRGDAASLPRPRVAILPHRWPASAARRRALKPPSLASSQRRDCPHLLQLPAMAWPR
jgi:uncharacterized membrane protein